MSSTYSSVCMGYCMYGMCLVMCLTSSVYMYRVCMCLVVHVLYMCVCGYCAGGMCLTYRVFMCMADVSA